MLVCSSYSGMNALPPYLLPHLPTARKWLLDLLGVPRKKDLFIWAGLYVAQAALKVLLTVEEDLELTFLLSLPPKCRITGVCAIAWL